MLVEERRHHDLENEINEICSRYPQNGGNLLIFHARLIFHGQKERNHVSEDRRKEVLVEMASLLEKYSFA